MFTAPHCGHVLGRHDPRVVAPAPAFVIDHRGDLLLRELGGEPRHRRGVGNTVGREVAELLRDVRDTAQAPRLSLSYLADFTPMYSLQIPPYTTRSTWSKPLAPRISKIVPG